MEADFNRHKLLNTISILGLTLAAIAFIFDSLIESDVAGYGAAATMVLLFLTVYLLNKRVKTQIASYIFIVGMWIFFTILTLISGGIFATVFAGQIITILIAGTLLGRRASVYTSLASAFTAVLFAISQWLGINLQLIVFDNPIMLVIQYVGLFLTASITLNVMLRENEKNYAKLTSTLQTETRQKEHATLLAEEFEELYKNAQFTHFAIENAADAAYWLSKQGEIVYANIAATRMLGYEKSTLIGMSIFEIEGRVTESSWGQSLVRLAIQKMDVKESIHIHRDGTSVPVEVTANYVKFDGEDYICCFARDISKRKAFEEELVHLATHDHLTQLPNRVLLHDRLGHSIEKAKRSKEQVALLLFDLDGFKRVNDELGHANGDLVLCEIAHRLMETLRASDSIARLGGDEFTVIVEGVKDLAHIQSVVHKVLAAIEKPFHLEDITYVLTASMGVALYPMNGEDPDRLLRVADMAMYKAKNNGHQFVVAEPGIFNLEKSN